MSLVSSALFTLGGCNRETLSWARRMNTFEEAWERWENGPELAYVLARVGFPFDDVVADALDVAKDHIVLLTELRHITSEIGGKSPVAAYNVWARLSQLAQIRDEDIVGALKSRFALEDFAAKLMEALVP